MQTKDISAIAELPSRDQRLHALAQTGLVRKWEEGDWCDGLSIWSGKIGSPSPHGWVTPFPFDLLKVTDAQFSAEVWEVLFGQNRILLRGDLAKSLSFLKDHIDAVKHIKALDVQFSQEDAIRYWEDGPRDAWEKITEFIATDLKLDQLDLCLDAGPTYESYREMGASEDDLDFLPQIYQEIVYTLAGNLAGKKPKSFSIYWVAFFDMEAQGEKEIMGQDYDSEKLGKIPHTRRASYFPHGAPKKELEEPDGLQL